MTGQVTADLEAMVPLRLLGPDRRARELTALIDTGFNGYLTAPGGFIEALALPLCGHTEVELGDGQLVSFPTFEALVEWFGQKREITVLASAGGFMVGMSLLRGCRLSMDIEPEGLVDVVPRAKDPATNH